MAGLDRGCDEMEIIPTQKTIGTYPTNNNSSDQAAAFVSMPVLFVICILFILMILT